MILAQTHEFRIPYMVGVYLAVNAIPDVWLLTDGPDCLFFKAEFVHGAQDFHSTLLDVKGRHRVAHTLADINNVVLDREAHIAGMIERLATEPEAGMVLVSALPMASITGTQYDRIARDVAVRTGKPVTEVPARSLQGDWLDGYTQVLAAVAREIPAPPGLHPSRDTVAIVGPLVDRTEADRLADVRELRRILEDGLGLRVASIWPSNVPVRELADVFGAGTLISLPYGRKAAKILKKRTGARLVEASLPVGIDGTSAFVREVAAALDRQEAGERFLQEEKDTWNDRMRHASQGIDGRRFIVIGDPWLAPATIRMIEDAGGLVVAAQTTSSDMRPIGGLPSLMELESPVRVDMVVAPTRGIDAALKMSCPFFEFGFTSYGTHAFFDAPTVGFGGAVNVLSAMSSSLSLFERLNESGRWDLRSLAERALVTPGDGLADTRG